MPFRPPNCHPMPSRNSSIRVKILFPRFSEGEEISNIGDGFALAKARQPPLN